MDFTLRERKDRFKTFAKVFDKIWKDGNYHSGKEFMTHTQIAQGNEGVANKSVLPGLMFPIVTKVIDIHRLRENKNASLQLLNSTPDKVYKLFHSVKAFNKPSLIEIIAMTMTNQLIFQGICPHFVLNYHWDYTDKDVTLNLYNEFINYKPFDDWAKEPHDTAVWFNALFQILMGLIAMERFYNMHHTDFHLNNIMVQKVQPGGYWTYILNKKKYYVPNLGFVFLINDLGYAWIPPRKLYLNYHYQDTLQYATKIGKEYYDISAFVQMILYSRRYSTSGYFKTILTRAFFPKDIDNVLSSSYYKKRYERAMQKQQQTNAEYYLKRLEASSYVKKTFTGSQTTLESKIHDLFHLGLFFNQDTHNERLDYTYGVKPSGEKMIERYNLDRKLDTKKLPANFVKHLLNN